MLNRRVVVTGLGLVTPLGSDVNDVWSAILNGHSAIESIKKFDITNFVSKIGGMVDSSVHSGFNAGNEIDVRDMRKMDVFIQYGMVASIKAIEDSGWLPQDEKDCAMTGVVVGSGIGGLETIEKTSISLDNSNNSKVTPYFIPASLINLLPGHISMKYGFTGINHSIATACATGTHAIGTAMRAIQYGDADVVIAGGAEAPITPAGIAGFTAARALSTKYNDTPKVASRPWDQGRDGFVIAEGAGTVVLEEYEHAIKRRAKIYAELVGYGATADAYHITSPHPDGRGGYMSIQKAINDAKINISDINYINAHATSTYLGDKIELHAVQKLFLNDNPSVLMSSTKSSIGHLLGASGSVELIFSILALRDQVAPPTLNLYNPISDAKIDLVPLHAKEAKINYALSNSFGFGGTNASLLVKKL